MITWLDPVGLLIGLNGVILLAYIVAIPANEIVIPTVLMLTVLATHATGVGEGAGVMFELDSATTDSRRPARWRLDVADRHQPDALQPAAQSLLHDDLHDLQGDRQREMDDRGDAPAAGPGGRRLFLRGPAVVPPDRSVETKAIR